MRLDDLDYALPEELIAQSPAAERTAARLLELDRESGALRHHGVADLPTLLRPGDLVVVNDSRVIRARVAARRPTGGQLEVLFVRPTNDAGWEAIVRGSPRAGERVDLPEATGVWTRTLGDGRWHLRVDVPDVVAWLDRVGAVPLPPYIRRPDGPSAVDGDRYQTVYARNPGSIAAPTAGLHLSDALLDGLRARGVTIAPLTLHVGPGTFLPVRTATLEEHTMHGEPFVIPGTTIDALKHARDEGRRVVAVGTTTVRTLEAAVDDAGQIRAAGEATLFIRPGHRFRVVDAMLTNFHLPKSTLLALVAAFAGLERMQAAYAEAVGARYRFYSFGDAMLIQ